MLCFTVVCSVAVAPLSENKMAHYRQASLDDGLDLLLVNKLQTNNNPIVWSSSAINITENPISEAVVC